MAGRPRRETYKASGKTDGKRRDKNRAVLKTGEAQRPDGRYYFRWTDRNGRRHVIYANTLKELREKEAEITRDILDGIKTMDNCTLNDIYALWLNVKRGLKDNTLQNYKYYYEQYVKDYIGRYPLRHIKKSDIRQFYNKLIDEGILRIRTIDVIQNVLHQVLDLAVDDGYIRTNPADKAFMELKRTRGSDSRKHKALSMAEQEALLSYLRNNERYERWYPLIAFMLGTGMRVGEVTGLRWVDVDFENEFIDINHTLVYYDHGNTLLNSQ